MPLINAVLPFKLVAVEQNNNSYFHTLFTVKNEIIASLLQTFFSAVIKDGKDLTVTVTLSLFVNGLCSASKIKAPKPCTAWPL